MDGKERKEDAVLFSDSGMELLALEQLVQKLKGQWEICSGSYYRLELRISGVAFSVVRLKKKAVGKLSTPMQRILRKRL